MIYRTTSAGNVIAKIYRDLGNTITIADWEQDAMEWIGEALEHIGAGVQMEKKEAIITLTSFRGLLPNDLVQLIDVFYSSGVTADTSNPQKFVATVTGGSGTLSLTINGVAYAETFDSSAATTVTNWVATHAAALLALDEPVTATEDSAVITLILDPITASFTVTDSSTTMVAALVETAAINLFPDSIKYPLNRSSATMHTGVHPNIRDERPDFQGESYQLTPDYIRFSQETGYLAITYLGLPVDANGYPMVPDDVSYREGFFWYILKMLILRGWKHPDPNITWAFADMKWNMYCTQARNQANTPDLAGYELFLQSWRKLLQPDASTRENFFDKHDVRNPDWVYGNEGF